jgi:hypothetical protein
VDHDAIGRGNIARYIYSRLGGKALEHARPKMENIVSGAMNKEELISHLMPASPTTSKCNVQNNP